MNKTNNKRRGFTLIETLVAMTIFFTVIMTIYFTWESIVLTTRDANEQTARTQRERVALRTIKEALHEQTARVTSTCRRRATRGSSRRDGALIW